MRNNKVGDITKEGFVCLYGLIGTDVYPATNGKCKIRISSNAEGHALNPLKPQAKEQEYKFGPGWAQ